MPSRNPRENHTRKDCTVSHFSNFRSVKVPNPYIRAVLYASMVVFGASCSWLPFSRGCCNEDRQLGVAYLQEPGQFQTATPQYGRARDVDPGAGETVTKPSLLSKYNPFKGFMDEDEPAASSDDGGFFGNLLPF